MKTTTEKLKSETDCSSESCSHWMIYIGGGYGEFYFEGSEEEAEAMRRHKARWEQAVGRKRPATQNEIDKNNEGELS